MTLRLFPIAFLIFLITGCAQKPPEPIPLSEAHQKFLKACQDEFKITPILKPVENTLWIYLPLEESIVASQAANDKASQSSTFDIKADMRYIDGKFNEKDFLFQYDITKKREYHVTPGYTSTMSEHFQKLQQNILLAFQRGYMDTTEPPEIIVLVIADITSGIEVETYMHFEDLKQSMSIIQTLAAEESSKRFVSEIRGDKKIIGDETGEHIPNRGIPLGEFLAKQVVQRIKFKYTQSAFPPSDNTPEEIATILKEAFQIYHFKDFNSVMLEDLLSDKKFQVRKEDLTSDE